MKNIVSLVTREEITSYMGALWQTDIFRESHTNGFIGRVVDQFAWLPRIFAEETNNHLERAHFSTWWNVIMKREYDNPYIHDLYYLHEIAHAASMCYVPNMGRRAFDDKMQRNELEASVLSEIQVYFEMPGLRAKSFWHEIYADRFLGNSMQALWRANRLVCIDTIRAMRKDVMVGKSEHLLDSTEKWIRRFAEQNDAYSITWSPRYNDIEETMAEFQQMVADSIVNFPNKRYSAEYAVSHRAQAAKQHLRWIEREAALDPIDNIPFRAEAELFTPFYWANKARYDAAMKVALC